MIAPPTIAVHRSPEALGFKSPSPSIAKVKIVGNIIELNKPTHSMLHMAIKPVLTIEMDIQLIANKANNANTFPGFIIRVR